METPLSYEKVLELFAETDKRLAERAKNFENMFENLLIKEREEREQRYKEADKRLDKSLKKSRKEFDKKLGELSGTWGKFVAEMVRPKIVELFKERGIQIETSLQSVLGYKDGQKYYEIDLLLINTNVAVVVEIKSSLSVGDVNEHLERLEKIKQVSPKLIDLSGVTIYGAVAGMIVEGEADKYAYKKGLYVLRQEGNIVEIANDDKFKPKEWKVLY